MRPPTPCRHWRRRWKRTSRHATWRQTGPHGQAPHGARTATTAAPTGSAWRCRASIPRGIPTCRRGDTLRAALSRCQARARRNATRSAFATGCGAGTSAIPACSTGSSAVRRDGITLAAISRFSASDGLQETAFTSIYLPSPSALLTGCYFPSPTPFSVFAHVSVCSPRMKARFLRLHQRACAKCDV